MKLYKTLSVLSLFASAAIAHATDLTTTTPPNATPNAPVDTTTPPSEPTENRNGSLRPFVFDFNCLFGAPSTETNEAELERSRSLVCAASARVFALAHDHEHLNELEATRAASNLLAVSCDNQLLYADSALLFSGRKAVKITGANGVTPAIIVPRKEDVAQEITTDSMRFEAFLRLDRHKIPGYCSVKARELGSHLN